MIQSRITRKVLCPVDMSECSAAALRRAVDVAARDGAKLYILFVEAIHHSALPGAGNYAPEHDEYSRFLRETRLARHDIDYEQHYARGNVADEITRFAYVREIDTVIMGTHGRTGLMRHLMGSVARSVCRRMDCRVETVQGPAVSGAR